MKSLIQLLNRSAARPDSPVAHQAGRQVWRWVPIRMLQPRHRQRIEDHLLALNEHDRYLRFGYAASDERIRAYARSIDFARDEVFGIFNRRLHLVAMTHLAYESTVSGMTAPATPSVAEFSVSVRESARSRGYGARLFAHAVMHARNRRITHLMIHALSENTPMLRIARRAGARIERSGGESEAWLVLPPDTVGSQLEELCVTHAAELSYGLRFRWRQMLHLLSFGQVATRP